MNAIYVGNFAVWIKMFDSVAADLDAFVKMKDAE